MGWWASLGAIKIMGEKGKHFWGKSEVNDLHY